MDIKPQKQKGEIMWSAVKKTIFPGFFLAFVYNITGVIDTLLAGAFFQPAALAAVGVVIPVAALFQSLLLILVQGTYFNYTLCIGRGQRRKASEVLTVGIVYLVIIGTLFTLICHLQAHWIVRLAGAVEQELQLLAGTYLKYISLSFSLAAITRLFTLILNVYGYQKDSTVANVINLLTNLGFSVFFLFAFPEMGIGALGLGTLAGILFSLTSCFFFAGYRKLPLKLYMRRQGLKWYRFREMVMGGFTVSLNAIIDSQIGALINVIIVHSSLGPDGLALFAVVNSIWCNSHIAGEGMDCAASPMIGVAYALKDRSGVKTVFVKEMVYAFVYTLLWSLILLALTPFLLGVYLKNAEAIPQAEAIVRSGVRITLLLSPFYTVTSLLSGYFDTIDHLGISLGYAILPDSVVFPLFLWILIPQMGYNGIWIAMGGAAPTYLLLRLVLYLIRRKEKTLSVDGLLALTSGRLSENAAIDTVFQENVQGISHLSERIQSYLTEQKAPSRIAYFTALCVDELATDMTLSDKTSRPIEMKIQAEENGFLILMIRGGSPYNPLDFEFDRDNFSRVGLMMVQKIAEKIDYRYIYGTNLITIHIGK